MADISIEIKGLDRVLRGFQGLPGALQKAVREGMGKALWLVGSEAKMRAPVDTGRLRASIGVKTQQGIYEVKPIGAEIVGRIGSRVVYAPYQELGWTTRSGRHIPGRHYLEGALKAKADAVVKLFERIIDKVIR